MTENQTVLAKKDLKFLLYLTVLRQRQNTGPGSSCRQVICTCGIDYAGQKGPCPPLGRISIFKYLHNLWQKMIDNANIFISYIDSFNVTRVIFYTVCCVNLFPGTAYIHGLKHATGNFVIIMDADLSHHVSKQHLRRVDLGQHWFM